MMFSLASLCNPDAFKHENLNTCLQSCRDSKASYYKITGLSVAVFPLELIHLFVFTCTSTLQEENLWQKQREEELHRTMTQLNLLDKHRNAFAKKNMLFSQEHMVSFTDSGNT